MRRTNLNPDPTFPLEPRLARIRVHFLEACRHNNRAKETYGTARDVLYSRKCWLARRVVREDPDGEVVVVSSVEEYDRGMAKFGLCLKGDPHFGIHLPPLAVTSPLAQVLLA